MDRINILDTTFTIPVMLENRERLKHLITTVLKINEFFLTNIIIGELSTEPTLELKKFCQYNNCGYVHFKNTNSYFHRTKLLNDLARITTTPFIVNYDADVAMETNAVIETMELLRNDTYDIVIPYSGMVVNVIDKKQSIITSKKASGGAVFWNKISFFRCGMENENFVDWGFEDNERLSRAKKLGLAIRKLPQYKLFHLDHVREERHNNDEIQAFIKNNKVELNKIVDMSREELITYVKTWKWI